MTIRKRPKPIVGDDDSCYYDCDEINEYFDYLIKTLEELKFCDGTVECFGCPEQGEAECDWATGGCIWVTRFEQIKKEFLEALR